MPDTNRMYFTNERFVAETCSRIKTNILQLAVYKRECIRQFDGKYVILKSHSTVSVDMSHKDFTTIWKRV
jgi:hypothetical protein